MAPRNATWIVLLLCFSGSLCLAQEPRPGQLAATIAPFVDAQTLAIVHADLAAFDASEAVHTFASLFHLSSVERDRMQALVAPIYVFADSLPAGATADLFFVVSVSDFSRIPVFVVLPVSAAAPAIALEIRRDLAAQFKTEVVAEELHGCLVVGSVLTIARLKKAPTVARPEVQAGFEAVGESAIQVLIVPSADALRLVEAFVPKLPPALGGVPTRDVTRHLQWAAVGLSLPPNDAGLRLAVQAIDESSAKALADLIGRFVTSLRTPDELGKSTAEKLTARLAPTVDGARVTLDVTATVDEVAEFGALLAPLLSVTQGTKTDRP
jgi:hypothetical protein